MNIKPFKVEEWMNKWEVGAKYNIAETCVDSISIDQLFELTGENKQEFLQKMSARRLSYGDIEGMPELREGIASLYKTIKPENIIPVHGAAGANHHVFYSLIEPGDEVISIMPTYQQLTYIPQSFEAKVKILQLTNDNGYLPYLDSLKELVSDKTKMICINNPNNPTGALMSEEILKEIIEIAKSADAWILCDEVYRHLTQEDSYSPSIADLYEKGISVGSMSKVFSLAGLRLGWIATHDTKAIKSFLSHRDYNLISCGMIDEMIASIALKNKDKLLKRNLTIVRENLEILDNWVKQEKHVNYIKPKAGTTALIYYELDIPSVQFCEEMYKTTGAFVTPGDCFEMPQSMRIGYAYGKQDLINGLKAISEFIKIKTEGEK